MSSRTIDNLGYDASQRYAEDQQLLYDNEQIHKDSRILSGRTQIDVISPSYGSEVDVLFNADKKNTSWAQFAAPSGYTEQRKKFFLHEILPSLSLHEKTETYTQKILAQMRKKTPIQDESDDQEKKRALWQDAKDEEENEKEKSTLIGLLNCILNLDKCMLYVNSKRTQYQKG